MCGRADQQISFKKKKKVLHTLISKHACMHILVLDCIVRIVESPVFLDNVLHVCLCDLWGYSKHSLHEGANCACGQRPRRHKAGRDAPKRSTFCLPELEKASRFWHLNHNVVINARAKPWTMNLPSGVSKLLPASVCPQSLQVHLKSTRGPIDVLICSDEPLPMEVTNGDLDSDVNRDAAADSLYSSFVQMPLKSEPCF